MCGREAINLGKESAVGNGGESRGITRHGHRPGSNALRVIRGAGR